MFAAILVGGLGTRLGELTQKTPKPMLDVGGVPFLERLVLHLARKGVDHILLLTCRLADQIEKRLGDGARLGVKIEQLRECSPLGTGGAVKNAFERLPERFLLLNGDTLFDVDVKRLWDFHAASGRAATLALRAVPDVSRYGDVELANGRIVRFREKGRAGPGLVSGGVYVLERSALGLLPEGKCSIETDLFPRLVEAGGLGGVAFDGYFLDIGLPETLDQARRELPELFP